MNDRNAVVISFAAAVIFGAGTWWIAPRLQDARTTLDARVDEGAEKARRMLDRYDTGLEINADLARRLHGPEGARSAEQWSALAEEQSRQVEQFLSTEEERLKGLLGTHSGRAAALEERMRTLDDSIEAAPRPGAFPKNVPGMAGAMGGAVKDRTGRAAENLKTLRDSVTDVQAAMDDSERDASGSDHLLANRLAGVALGREGAAAAARADAARRGAQLVAGQLVQLAARARAAEAATRLVENSGVRPQMDKARAAIGELESQVAAMTGRTADLRGRIGQLKTTIAGHTAAAEQARAALEALEEQGVKFEDPDGLDKFRRAYEEQARTYRQAVRSAQQLANGTLGNARLEDGADYLEGHYVAEQPGVPISQERGLDEYERELAALELEQSTLEEMLTESRARLQGLQILESGYVREAEAARQSVTALAESIRERTKALADAVTGLLKEEDEALARLKQATLSFETASRLATDRTTNPPPVPESKKDASPSKWIAEDRWLGAQTKAQAADMRIQQALLLYDRFVFLGRVETALAAAGNLVDRSTLDAAAWAKARDEARETGTKLADEAITRLEAAARDLENHWTVAATLAAGNYAFAALSGDVQMLNVAMANYQAAVEGRENSPLVRTYVERLAQLRDRGSAAPPPPAEAPGDQS